MLAWLRESPFEGAARVCATKVKLLSREIEKRLRGGKVKAKPCVASLDHGGDSGDGFFRKSSLVLPGTGYIFVHPGNRNRGEG